MRLRLVTPPDVAVPVVSLADAKDHLQVIGTAQDAMVTAMVAAAVSHLDGATGVLGRCLINQTWELSLDGFPPLNDTAIRNWQNWNMQRLDDAVRLPLAPLASVSSVKYVDTTGVLQTLPPSLYLVDSVSEPGVLTPAFGSVWPSTRDQRNAVTIQYVAGYGVAPSAVPAALIAAIKLMVGDLFENREGVTGDNRAAYVDNPTVDRLIFPFRLGMI
jgi:uncharacterized phiE125 gp8 family phage protein